MAIVDKVLKDVSVSYEGVFDFKDFLAFMKKMMKDMRYDITEKLYDAKTKNGVKSILIKWECDRKPTDYDKYIIKLKITASDLKEGQIDSGKVQQGKTEVEINGEHEKDYDEKWKKPKWHFWRAVFDKFVIEDKQKDLAKKLKEDCLFIEESVKKYFNIK